MRYLLHTNMVSALLRDPHGKVAARLLRHGIDQACTSIVVAAELRYGIARMSSPHLSQALDRHFEYLKVMPVEAPVDIAYGAIRADLERRGQLIGPNYLFIAAHAVALACRLLRTTNGNFRG